MRRLIVTLIAAVLAAPALAAPARPTAARASRPAAPALAAPARPIAVRQLEIAPKETILGWINQYRFHPEPDKVPAAVHGMSRLGLLDRKSVVEGKSVDLGGRRI